MSFQLPTKEEKHDYVLEQFERIAKGYDLSNDVISMGMHRAWKLRAVLELIGERGAGKYLDVCCGTGDLALIIAKHLKPGSSVTGFDFAQNMLDLAAVRQEKAVRRQERLAGSGKEDKLKNVQINWVRGDAQNLPFADNSFDGAINSFGLRNLTDLQKGVSEMARVVKPGGYVINLDLGHCEMPLFAPIFAFYFSRVVPVIGGILQNDKTAYTYLPESLTTYPKPDGITAIFQKAGLKDVVHIPLAFGTVAMHRGLKL
ncbi:MAG: ubiquinone/menaquinone biosynthesis methyltransferase [Cyanobacteria bacterium REEB67]|jgi:demethylmenaquinone methyltransferase / 2-methoxy-6-polyprenyl-1,4-benzoquinol methylase|nr:ubiquinone/menaquinone biosynthesis methyltransferase [Cyanobacteria bacterium REEB67]